MEPMRIRGSLWPTWPMHKEPLHVLRVPSAVGSRLIGECQCAGGAEDTLDGTYGR